MNSISIYYLVHLWYAYVVHLGWETNSKAIIICLFIILKLSSACYHYFWIHPLVVTITLDFCMLSLHNLTIFFCMHVRYCTQSCWTCREKEKSFALQYNVMQTSLHGGFNANPPPPSPDCNPEEDIYSEADSDAIGHSYLPPKVFALTWHDDVSHIMHMLPCSAYFWHHICHLLSLDMFYNATYLVSISYMGLCSLMSFSQP